MPGHPQADRSCTGRPRLQLAGLLCLAASLFVAPAALAQGSYPDKTVRVIVGFPAGTGPDFVARLISQKLGENLKQSFVVDNKAGAGGLIGAQELTRAAPDGYTLYLGTVAEMGIAPSSYSRLPYDPQRDFAPISHVASADFAFVVPQSHPAKTVKEYADWFKRRTDPPFLATFGAGTPGHFGAVMFANAVGVKLEPVHFKTTGDAMASVMSGEVPGLFGTIALVAPQVKSGKLRALGTTGAVRSQAFAELPTFKEAGYPEVEFDAWFGFFAPAKTPVALLDKLNAELLKAVQSPDVKAKLAEAGMRAVGSKRGELAGFMAEDIKRWAGVVKATGFKAD